MFRILSNLWMVALYSPAVNGTFLPCAPSISLWNLWHSSVNSLTLSGMVVGFMKNFPPTSNMHSFWKSASYIFTQCFFQFFNDWICFAVLLRGKPLLSVSLDLYWHTSPNFLVAVCFKKSDSSFLYEVARVFVCFFLTGLLMVGREFSGSRGMCVSVVGGPPKSSSISFVVWYIWLFYWICYSVILINVLFSLSP